MRIPPIQSLIPALIESTNSSSLLVMTGLLSTLALSTPAAAQMIDVSVPTVIGSHASCAASANATGHMICLMGSGGKLLAASMLVGAGQFTNAGGLDSTNQALSPNTTGPNNPLTLTSGGAAITGTVGNSNCSSTADATADVVCAFNAAGSLMGVRFSILANTQTTLVRNLGVAVVGNPSCAIGDARFALGSPGTPGVAASEGVNGETICAFRTTNNELMGVAFNPASGTEQVQDLGIVATGDPSCAGNVDNTNDVICAFLTASGLAGVAFDPRTAPQSLVHQSLYAGTSFAGNPGCATSNDLSGDVICTIRNSTNDLVGFAFAPRAATATPLQTLGSGANQGASVTGTPSCAANSNNGNEVICAFVAAGSTVTSIAFDPRNPTTPTFVGSSVMVINDVSCTFQNVNGGQVSCGGSLPSLSGEFFGVILGAPTPGTKITPQNPVLSSSVMSAAVGQEFSISWTAEPDATSYKVYENNLLFETVTTTSAEVAITSSPSFFQVQACNAFGCDTGSRSIPVTSSGGGHGF
jgi:hypothetical protein